MDIDIDFADRSIVLDNLVHRVAIIDQNKKHNTGVYFTDIPYNPITNYSTVNYKEAEDRGFFKVDFLNVSIYKDVKDEEHLTKLMSTTPMWDLLLHEEFVDQLFHLSGHTEVTRATQPTSVEQLAAVLAMIRPAKRYLIGKDWDTILKEVWVKPTSNEYYFKKAHAISYAVAVVVHMNLLCELINS